LSAQALSRLRLCLRLLVASANPQMLMPKLRSLRMTAAVGSIRKQENPFAPPQLAVSISTAPGLEAGAAVIDDIDPNRAFNSRTGQNFVRVPCPPASVTTTPPKPTPTPKEKKEACDLEFGYNYMRAPDESAKNLNGFGGSLFCNVKPWIAVGGDFGALFGSTTDTVGTIKFDTSLHRQTYLFGPEFDFYPNDKVKIFIHPLFGGVHDTTKTTIGTTSVSSSATTFAVDFGGGVDIKLNKHFFVRPFQVDYMLTDFGGQRQNNVRFSSGIGIRFLTRVPLKF
jgi:hypothetical protein